MGWGEFALALGTFFLSHSVPLRAPVRSWATEKLGRPCFTILYSGLSLAVLAWLILAAGRAPYIPLWSWAPWQNYAVLATMLPACVIVALALGRPNPFSFGGMRNHHFDPTRPGVVGWMRHPLLVALALWSGSHMLANGDLGHVILFGTFAVFALAGMKLIDRRKQRQMGAAWHRLREQAANSQRLAVAGIAGATLVRIAAGVALYASVIGLHPVLFGVSPLP